MQEYTDYATVLSIKPSYCTVYRRNEQYVKGSRKMTELQLANIRGKKYTGQVTVKSSKKMQNAVGWLISLAREKRAFNKKFNSWFDFKVTFITLTLSSAQFDSDKVIKRGLFNSFMIAANRKFKMTNYVWRAEAQANGNIHFHILSDVFIDYMELRELWNHYQKLHGYITADSVDQNPNSTDIHSLKSIHNVGAYVSKYCTKVDETRRVIEGKIYGISDGLNRVTACQIVLDQTKTLELNQAVIKNKSEVRKMDYAVILYLPVMELIKSTKFAFKEVVEYINSVYYKGVDSINDILEQAEIPSIKAPPKVKLSQLVINF